MVADKTLIERNFDSLVRDAITAILKPRDFKKTRLNFRRRLGQVVQVVNVQQSQGNFGNYKAFYVNVGLAFDSVCIHLGVEVSEEPVDYECDQRGIRQRLELLIPTAPARWTVPVADGELATTTSRLKDIVVELATELDQIDGLPAFRSHDWFNKAVSRPLNAQVLYLLGEFDGAWSEIRSICDSFAGRRLLSQPQHWIRELKLNELESRL